jgi:tetratricopeptide (TPR) repeat protein
MLFAIILMIPAVAAPQESADQPDPTTLKQLSIAYSQHEIVQLLIQKGDYQKAFSEFSVILDLGLPEQYEEAVFKEIVIVAKKFFDEGQSRFAYEALQKGFDSLRRIDFKARLLNVKASLLKREGKIDEAIKTYKQEVALREGALEK